MEEPSLSDIKGWKLVSNLKSRFEIAGEDFIVYSREAYITKQGNENQHFDHIVDQHDSPTRKDDAGDLGLRNQLDELNQRVNKMSNYLGDDRRRTSDIFAEFLAHSRTIAYKLAELNVVIAGLQEDNEEIKQMLSQ